MSDLNRNWVVDDICLADGRPGFVQVRAVCPAESGEHLYVFVPAEETNLPHGSGIDENVIATVEGALGVDAAAALRAANTAQPDRISVGDTVTVSLLVATEGA